MAEERSTALQRMVLILDCFLNNSPELGVREIARRTNLSTSATGRLLMSMRELGILTQNPTTKGYLIGSRILSWAGVYSASLDVRNVALPELQKLHLETQETISLYIIEGTERVCVERFESPKNVLFVAKVGRPLPIYAGAAGKVLLAFSNPKKQKEILDQLELQAFTPRTITNKEALVKDLEKIKKQGYAVSNGEWSLEAAGVAAPLFEQSGEVVAAVTISGPAQRFTSDVIKGYVSLVVEVAARISRAMGHYPNSNTRPVNPVFTG